MATESVTQLFGNHSVIEIRNVEKKTRQEIEKKKEDLRQMVGERYRDLIEAADTIAEMKSCSLTLRDSVRSLQKYTTSKLKTGAAQLNAKSKQSTYFVERYMQLSAQVKLLMEVSELIWSRIEGGNMIGATHLYMQSRQVLKNLDLDGSTTYRSILSWFPVLGQQAQALDNLRSTILSECRILMKDDAIDSKSLAEALCSIVLLENTDLSQAFGEFMNARLSAVSDGFKCSDKMGAVKLCKVVALLTSTIKQAYSLFVEPIQTIEDAESGKKRSKISQFKPADSGLVQRVLRESYDFFSRSSTSGAITGLSEEKLWSRHLPESVTDLKVLKTSNQDVVVSLSAVQSTCTRWLEDCAGIIKHGTAEILLYVRTFKALSALRQSVWDTLSSTTDMRFGKSEERDSWKLDDLGSGDTEMSEWERACSSMLGRRLLLWDEILKSLFLDEVKTLSGSLFSDLLSNGKLNLEEALSGLKTSERSETAGEFMWQELPGDVLPDTAWRQVSVKKTKAAVGGLSLKALTVTPALHNTCVKLNSAMRQVIADFSNYIPDAKKEHNKVGSNSQRKPAEVRSLPVVSQEEKSLICNDFQTACVDCLKKFLEILSGHRKLLAERVSAEKSCVDEILFLAMFCRNFCQLCDEFHSGCMIGSSTEESCLKRQLSTSMTSSMMSQSIQSISSPAWEEISISMSQESKKFLLLWSDATLEKAVENFKTSMLNLNSAVHFFDVLPTWDRVKIVEESETGSKVESEIKLPMAVSWPVQELLFSVCNSISRVGGHSISRSTLQDITIALLSGALHTFVQLKDVVSGQADVKTTDLTTETPGSQPFSVTQTWALQRLFDLRVVQGLLHSSQPVQKTSNSGGLLFNVPDDAFSDLVDWLESYIDPFDLDVFAQHLTKNVQKNIYCSSIMLGFLSFTDKSDGFQSTHTVSKAGGNSHNIMPLTADCGRFSYLPISSRMSKPDAVPLPASIKNQLPLSSALKQLTEVDKRMEGGRKQSLYSKLGALSSSWLS